MRGKGGRQQRNGENLVLGRGLIAVLFRRGVILGSFRKEISPQVNFIELRGVFIHVIQWGSPMVRSGCAQNL
jgi:hypothetical protein